MISKEKMAEETTEKTLGSMEEESQQIPVKSRSLRARSIQKRLQTERNKNGIKSSLIETQEKDTFSDKEKSQLRSKNTRSKNRGGGRFGSGSTTMSKYRRKTANAKERDRMATVNEAFEKLKNVVPVDALLQQQQSASLFVANESEDDGFACDSITSEENMGNGGGLILGIANPLKSTKVTTLRCAISYINSLQKLIEDSEKGILDPSFYDHEGDDDKVSDIDMILGQQVSVDGDNNNNRDKKKKRKDKQNDVKGKKYLNKQKMSLIASSLNKNLSLRKINSKQKTNNFSNPKGSESDMFELEKVIKKGSRSKDVTTARNMSILNASIPEIMDIIRNATGMNAGKIQNRRKNNTIRKTSEKRRKSVKSKQRKGTILHVQKRSENISQHHSGIVDSQRILAFKQNDSIQPMIASNQRSSNIINNVLQYIQPVVENQGDNYLIKQQGINSTIPLSNFNNQPKQPQLMKNKISGGLTNGSNMFKANYTENKTVSSFTSNMCDTILIPRTNKLTPPQVKRLLLSLTPLMNPIGTSPILQSKIPIASTYVPLNSTLLLSPPPSNSSCSNYSSDETSTSSSFDDVNMNSNVESNLDTNSCLMSPSSSNNLLSSSSLHSSVSYNSKISPLIVNASQISLSSSTCSASENQMYNNMNCCSTNSSMDILDDIQQILKDAENFDILCT